MIRIRIVIEVSDVCMGIDDDAMKNACKCGGFTLEFPSSLSLQGVCQ